MDQKSSIDLMRLLHGELDDSAARQLRERIGGSPELQESYEAMERQWQEPQLLMTGGRGKMKGEGATMLGHRHQSCMGPTPNPFFFICPLHSP